MAGINNIQKNALLKEIASLIVNDKSKFVVVMNKSGINTVAVGTDNNVIADQVIENIVKSDELRKNLATLITDTNLESLLAQKQLNSTGSEGDTANATAQFTKTIQSAVVTYAESVGSNKNNKDSEKLQLKKFIAEAELDKKAESDADLWARRTKRLSNASFTILFIGSVALIGLGIYVMKKYHGK